MQAVISFPDIAPELVSITLFGIELALRWYALAYIGGVVLGYLLIRRALARPTLWPGNTAPMDREALEDLLFWLVIGIIVGGRLAFVLLYQPGYYLSHPGDIIKLWQGGMAFHGGFAGVCVATLIWCRAKGVSLASTADALALVAPIGIGLGRIANFINNELWGRPTDVPWAVAFPGPAAQNCPGVIGICGRHPSQLYEAGLEGLLLGLILALAVWRFGAFRRPWLTTGLFLTLYGLARFFVEFFRLADGQFISPDNPYGHVLRLTDSLGITMGQLLSLPMILIGLALVVLALRRAPVT
ncbi:prolipoprotein diacylglyceryl transferase [Pseudooceanicola sp.]|uniref:prolipoprotein diacylglyceryl transferase n=1 Tax=Pseudooceanicola sp. TaxID=1914328 RepID=UPI0026344C6E|nr:prolipoprotein diacylglyceryl transferase [Pseudooceanicola sp.]MDF1854431.1 prolipoprotein diacylglyceryl transferase [Pseudooceanicola sp.]